MDRRRRRDQHELPVVADQAHRAQSSGRAISRRPVPVREPDDLRPDLGSRPTAATRNARETNTCPLAMEFYSSNEYWVKAGSLMSTDPTGTFDLPDHPDARLYLLSSKQHGGAGNPTSKGLCQQFLNPLDSAQVQRALWEDLDQWSTQGVAPPPSRVPLLEDGTLVPPPPCRRRPLRRHPRGDVYRPQNDALPVQLRTELLRDRHTDDQPARHRAAVRGQPRKRSDLSELRAEGRQRRQRYRRDPVARIDGAAGDLHRLGPALRGLGERWLRSFGTIHPVPGDQGRAHCRGRSAAVGRRSVTRRSRCIALP